MIPIEIARTIYHALHSKIDLENRQINLEFTDGSFSRNKDMAKRHVENKRKTEEALAWLESQELQRQPAEQEQ